MNKQKISLKIPELLPAYSSTIVSSTLSFVNLGIVIAIASSSVLITSVIILTENEDKSKNRIRYTKSGDWVDVFTLRNGKTLKHSMIVKKLNQKEADKKMTFNRSLTKRSDFFEKNSV